MFFIPKWGAIPFLYHNDSGQTCCWNFVKANWLSMGQTDWLKFCPTEQKAKQQVVFSLYQYWAGLRPQWTSSHQHTSWPFCPLDGWGEIFHLVPEPVVNHHGTIVKLFSADPLLCFFFLLP
jgi:hypothetical protein